MGKATILSNIAGVIITSPSGYKPGNETDHTAATAGRNGKF